MEVLPSGEKSCRLFADSAFTFHEYAKAMIKAYYDYMDNGDENENT